MKNIEPKTLKGFRDFLPKEAKKRQYVIDALKEVFESYGFEPLETPALEYEEILLGKYGEEGDKLMYRFTDNGERKVALRYDQTVPLARVVAQYGSASSPQVISMPFKRYQIQPVWRAENTQKGRYREFLQCDADIAGPSSPLSDAEIIALAVNSIDKLGFKNFKVIINDRSIFNELNNKTIISIDKLKKIGEEGVLKELMSDGMPEEEAKNILSKIKAGKPTERLIQIFKFLEKMGIEKSKYDFSPFLARGLDYYTGLIFEVEVEGYSGGSVCGGGRYDNLIGIFAPSAGSLRKDSGQAGQAGREIPAVGFAFGFDRLVEAMEELNLFPTDIANSTTKVLVTVFSPDLIDKSLETASQLRSNNINTEIYLNENTSMEKQLKYADQKNIPYAVIIGPNEAADDIITLRNMITRKQKTIILDEIINELK